MSLPKIYKNKIEGEIRNSQDTFYSQRNTNNNDFLNQLPANALIETQNRIWQTKIVGKTNNYLVTSNGEIINFQDCLSIKKI